MNVFGTIYDNANTTPIAGASVTAADNTGHPLTPGIKTDSQGFFTFISSLFDTGARLLVTAPGYTTVLMDPLDFQSTADLGMDKGTGTAPGQLPASSPSGISGKKVLLVGGGIAALVLLSSSKRGKAMGDAPAAGSSVDWSKWALYGGIGIGAYFLLTKLGGSLSKLFTTGVSTNNQTVNTNTTNTSGSDLAASKAAGIDQTVQDGVLNSLANDAYTKMSAYSSGDTVDQDGVVSDIIQVNTLTDWNRLVQLYGTRQFNTGGSQSLCSWFAIECTSLDLGASLKLTLDPAHMAKINGYFGSQGINVYL